MHREMEEWLLQGGQQHEQTGQNTTCEEKVLPVKQQCSQISNLVETVYEKISEKKVSDEDLPPRKTVLNWKTLDPLKRRLVYDINPKVLWFS